MDQAKLAEEPSLVLTRFYPVEPEKVWRAWTDPQALKRWWGPGGEQPVALAELELRAGGRFRIVFGGPQGTDHEVRGVYREVVPNRKLVFTWNLHDAPPEAASVVSVLLNPVPGGTELEFALDPVFDPRAADGWRGAFKRLEALVPAL